MERKQRGRAGGAFPGRGIRAAGGLGLALTGVLFLLPLATVHGEPVRPGGAAPQTGTLPIDREVQVGAARDKGRVVKLALTDGTVEELSMDQYVFSVLAAEMPASFELEALKAQACAARTYTVVKQGHTQENHPQADVCTNTGCCQAYLSPEEAAAKWGDQAQEYTEKLQQAVSQTDGLGVLYQGDPIQAVFFSSAPGYTVDAVEVWGNQVDYLTSVSSPEGAEVPNFHSQVVLTTQQVKDAILAKYPGANLTGDPSGWFGSPVTNEGGTVSSLLVGGVTLTGGQVRNLFGLRSACFTVAWDGASFTFSVTGYGHGVGMSQYGANTMAQGGSDFREILTWYYTGTEVSFLW